MVDDFRLMLTQPLYLCECMVQAERIDDRKTPLAHLQTDAAAAGTQHNRLQRF
jgi:hypothetical protein